MKQRCSKGTKSCGMGDKFFFTHAEVELGSIDGQCSNETGQNKAVY